MLTSYTLNDIQKAFLPAFFARGEKLFHDKLVRKVWLSNDHLYAEVTGSRAAPYQQKIDVTLRNGKLSMQGSCECPIGRNCKHVVAALIHATHFAPEPQRSSSNKTTLSSSSQLNPVMPSLEKPKLNFVQESGTANPTTSAWLQQVNAVACNIRASEAPTFEMYRLLYALTPDSANSGISVRLFRTKRKTDGTYGKATPYNRIYEIASGFSNYNASDTDVTICKKIIQNNEKGFDRPRFGGSESSVILRLLIESGRAYWLNIQENPLRIIPPQTHCLTWLADERGHQHLGISLPPEYIIVHLDSPWQINIHTFECGEIITGLPNKLINILLRSPAFAPDQIIGVMQTLHKQMPNFQWPEPAATDTIYLPNSLPQARLVLLQAPILLDPYWSRRDSTEKNIPIATLSFRYHNMLVAHNTDGNIISQFEDRTRIIAHRDLPTEHNLYQYLKLISELRSVSQIFHATTFKNPDHLSAFGLSTQAEWMHLILDVLPQLIDEGWEIEIDPDFPYQFAQSDSEISIEIEDHSDNKWFSLDLGIELEGQRISLLPILIQTLRQFSPEQLRALSHTHGESTDKIICTLPDKRLLSIPISRLQGILSILIELFDSDRVLNQKGKLEFDITQAARLAELEAIAKPRWLGGERLLALGQKLRDFNGIQTVPIPTGLTTILRPYQHDGLNWLQFLREYGLAGILADDMGLGKTLQALAHILVEKESGRADMPCLVIAPTSLMFNWHAEAKKFTPNLRVLTLHGDERHQHFGQLSQYDLVLTTYPLLSRDKDHLLAQQFHLLILDEAHAIKNPKALATQIAHQIQARHRLTMTGTPMENHLGELWSQFHFLIPGLLGSADTFKRQFRNPIERQSDAQRSQVLTQRIRPFMLRRTKTQVMKELPPKTDIIRSCELTGPQRDLYESVRNLMQDKIRREINEKGFKKSQIVILDALLKLRQICCDPRLLKLTTARKVHQSAKLDMLTSLLPEMIEEGRRVLLFSQFTSMLDLIEPELDGLNIPFVRLSGDTKNRALPVQRFQDGEVPLFLISLKAGGVGLNLTAADTVIHYDPWWNPAVEDQATGRAHRMGQLNPVFSYKLTTIGTVEEKILLMQERKRELTKSIIDDPSTGVGSFSPEELISLFDPS